LTLFTISPFLKAERREHRARSDRVELETREFAVLDGRDNSDAVRDDQRSRKDRIRSRSRHLVFGVIHLVDPGNERIELGVAGGRCVRARPGRVDDVELDDKRLVDAVDVNRDLCLVASLVESRVPDTTGYAQRAAVSVLAMPGDPAFDCVHGDVFLGVDGTRGERHVQEVQALVGQAVPALDQHALDNRPAHASADLGDLLPEVVLLQRVAPRVRVHVDRRADRAIAEHRDVPAPYRTRPLATDVEGRLHTVGLERQPGRLFAATTEPHAGMQREALAGQDERLRRDSRRVCGLIR
jgi:hypothetical protein